MKSMFVPPNTCLQCEAHGVPAGARSIFMLEHDSICGYCGNRLWSNPGGELPIALVSVVRSLLEHGLFHLKPDSKYQPLSLYRGEIDDTGESMVMCTIAYSHELRNTENSLPYRPYRREDIACSLPLAVYDAASLIANTALDAPSGKVRPSLTMVDVSRDRKTMRFELSIPQEPAPGYQYAYERTRFELTWTDLGDSLAIPTPEMAAAAEEGDSFQREEFIILADCAALMSRCIQSMGNCGGSVSLYRQESEELFHAAAIARVIKDLRRNQWLCNRPPSMMHRLQIARNVAVKS